MNEWLAFGIFYAAGAVGFAVWWFKMLRKHPEIGVELEADSWPTWTSHAMLIVAWPVTALWDLIIGLPHRHRG